MTEGELIALAREAGLEDWAVYGRIESKEECLKRFATFVAAAEREACARVCDGWTHADGDQCAEAIRARGKQ